MKKLPKGIQKIAGLPYSMGLEIRGPHISFSGQLPDLDENKNPISLSLADQARQVLNKMKKLLNDCCLSFNNVFDVWILIRGEATPEAYKVVNDIYVEFLKEDKADDAPDRMFYGNASILFGALIEIKFKAVLQVPEFLSTKSDNNPDQE